MSGDNLKEMDMESLPSVWPEDLDKEAGRKFNIEKPGMDSDMLAEVTNMENSQVDFKRLLELTNYSEKGSSQLVKSWENKQADAVHLLHEELDILSKQRQEVERTKLVIQQVLEMDAEDNTTKFSKQQGTRLDNTSEANTQSEQALIEKLQENIKLLEKQSSPVEELSQILGRADYFLHFVLQNAPVVIGHQILEIFFQFME